MKIIFCGTNDSFWLIHHNIDELFVLNLFAIKQYLIRLRIHLKFTIVYDFTIDGNSFCL